MSGIFQNITSNKFLKSLTVKNNLVTVVLILGLFVFVYFDQTNELNQISNVETIPKGGYMVTDVIDGDTIELYDGRSYFKARLIGIDAPETKHPNKPVGCFGKEASKKLTDLLTGEQVLIEFDPTQDTKDRYDRLLVYVYRASDDLLINEYMISKGFAYEYTFSTPYLKKIDFEVAEQTAKNNNLGLWGTVCN